MSETASTMLGGFRVVDLTDARGYVCGRTLAQMGADVIKVEPPGGDEERGAEPLSPEGHGLRWWTENANKRGITLDIRREQGRHLLLRLLETADVIVESGAPGALARLGLGFEDLSERFPSLVYTSITPFGQRGPLAVAPASDLTIQAMGGHMYVTGDDDRAPTRVGLPVSALHSGVEAAAATLVALYERQVSGLGQHVDVSMQACLVWTLLNTTMTWELTGRNEMRGGAVRRERANPILTRLIWLCADGLVHFVPIAGGGGRSRMKSWDRLVTWMEAEGHGDAILRSREWNGADQYSITQDEYDELAKRIQAFLLEHTVAELYDRAVEDGLLLAPVSTVPEILESRQLVERDFFETVEEPAFERTPTMPGPFARLSRTPLAAPSRAPRPGEHNDEIFIDELLLARADLDRLVEQGVV